MPNKKGSTKYKEEEVEFLMDLIEELKPYGKAHWETLAARYNARAGIKGWVERDSDSIKVYSSD